MSCISVLRCSSSQPQVGCCTVWVACKKEDDMAGLYIIGGILALGLLIYLMIALLKPERF